MSSSENKTPIAAVFLRHRGCPFRCAFCNQKVVAKGKENWEKEELDSLIEKYPGKVEVGFYGGSFNFIDEDYQRKLLSWAYDWVRKGKVTSVRISVRPDNLEEDKLKYYLDHGVKVLELGVQSLDDEVLKLNLRGHTSRDALSSIERAKKLGFSVSSHIMLGLYGSSKEKDAETSKKLSETGTDMVRIHPTLVLRGSLYEAWYKKGIYKPLDMEKALELSKLSYLTFASKGIKVIRVGLHPDDVLRENVLAGPFHPAFGDMVKSRIFRDILRKAVKEGARHIYCNPKDLGSVYGFKGENRDLLKGRKVLADEKVPSLTICTDSSSYTPFD